MNKNQPNNQEDQEIDLTQISKKIGRLFEWINTFLFRCIQFFVKNAIVILILLVIGVGLGFYLDVTKKTYDHQIIVTPNFESTDYLYSKIDLIESKIKERDTVFLKEIVGIKNPKEIIKIEIKPITDVYKFIENKTENFELIKLMAEGGDIKKILEDNLTSKNYSLHTITFKTKNQTNNTETVQPILIYLNETDYYKKVQKETVNNIQIKMIQNDTIISQINGVLNGFSNMVNGAQKSDKLVYYNENTQLNDVIKTKETLINEQGNHRVDLVGLDKIIKDNSSTLNIENTNSVNGKLKLVLPVLFLLSFILIRLFLAYYKSQLEKSKMI
ncbi:MULTISPECIES: hypothetical protein [unclassified Flavobacterium]|uniref:hypothetical protein n=1 Tax=unclassified Flavobacterium TaxID=196869 RepID=UPI000C1A3354|nr:MULTISPECIES: hypothetical protein [unclassified Flavobacterium]PIF61317.1 hypothetical protein CLV00_0883 [Flavobacterium sp. 11]WKL42448.1 hypothetical protein Q1W72_08720 [Flavobacterium sp. ZE23DGlu08]